MKKLSASAYTSRYGLNLKNFGKLILPGIFSLILVSCDKEQVQTKETVKDEATADESLIYYFPFSGNSIDQVSKKEYDTHGAKFASDRKIKANSALCLEDNWMDLAAGLGDEEGTLSFWINVSNLSNPTDPDAQFYDRFPIFEKQYFSTFVPGEYTISLTEGGRIYTECRNKWFKGEGEIGISTPEIIQVNKWYHVVLRWNDLMRKVEIFVNNKKMISYDYDGDGSEYEDTDEPHTFMGKFLYYPGSHSDSILKYYEGRIDEIRRYSKWISDSEIADLYSE